MASSHGVSAMAGSKYHAVKWHGYDSKKEARRAEQLKALQEAGEITELREQVPYVLIPAQWEERERYGKRGQKLKPGRKCLERPCVYVADFVYRKNGQEIVEDTKGVKTPEYIIKRKLMLYIHGIKIREV